MEVDFAIHQANDHPSVHIYKSDHGAQIAQLPILAFPGFWVYAYLILFENYIVLIDTGSGFGQSNQNLEDGLRLASRHFNTEVSSGNLTHIFITHGHIDHFGGLAYLRDKTTAKIGVHGLDLRNLTHTDEHIAIIARRLKTFLIEAGVERAQRESLLQLYHLIKLDYQPGPVDFTYEDRDMQIGPFEILHVPGHCAGHVLIRLHDIIFGGDHILTDISPHQAPEQLALHTGLRNYLLSLQLARKWAPGNRLVLTGHNSPVTNLGNRIDAIDTLHRKRLEKIRKMLSTPQTIAHISHALFGTVHGYNVLLALEETGAHIEYLSQQGKIKIYNDDDLRDNHNKSPIFYQNLESDTAYKH